MISFNTWIVLQHGYQFWELIKKSKSHQEVLSQFLQKVMVLDNIPAEQISSVLYVCVSDSDHIIP